jgi:putative ABC transport system permease protein
MSFLSAIRVALAALLIHKGRSALTSLGIVIGIGAVIGMVSAGDGARLKLDQQLESVGKDLLVIRSGAHTSQGSIADFVPFRADDASVLRKRLGERVVGVAEIQLTQRVVSTRTRNWLTMITGCTPDMVPVREWHVTEGRFLTEADVKKEAAVCVLAQTVKEKLFPDVADPIGHTVRVDQVRLRVIGVVGPKGRSPIGADQDDQIFIPITTIQHRIVGEERITTILTKPRDPSQTDAVKEEVIRVLRENHHLKAGSEDFDVSSVSEMAAIAVVMTTTMRLLIAVIASISLVVGGIGIMNIMLVSVTERTREIGIRMAVGATPADVLSQFLIEAVVLALLGGLIGTVLGIGVAALAAHLVGWPLVIEPWVVLIAFAVCAAVGVFFGYYPARRASSLDPIEALRYE